MGRKGARGTNRANPHLNQNISINVTHSSVESTPIREDQTDVVIKSLNLTLFKTKKCSLKEEHNHKQCPNYHNAMDKKRPGNGYSMALCRHFSDYGCCPNGDDCDMSHNKVEQLYREDKYKKKFCTKYPDKIDECEYGEYCSFAHSENELKTDLIHNYVYDVDFFIFHYKTMWCPFNLTQHDKALCVYAHNWQDFRRRPDVYEYDPEHCPNWKSGEFIGEYFTGCNNSFSCNKCHGWKEYEFHPMIYKVKPCKISDRCNKESHCSMYHSEADRRLIDTRIHQKLMKYFPKNRIIKNTFKHNRGSEGRGSLSKSLSRDEVYDQGRSLGTKSNKAANKGADNLLKKSLKNHQKMSLKDKGQVVGKKGHKFETSYKSLMGYHGPKTMSNEGGGTFDPMSSADRYPRPSGGEFAQSVFTNAHQVNENIYSDRPEYITPRYGVGSGIFPSDLKNHIHHSFIEKRSRSVHLQEKSSEQENGPPIDSIFKRKNNELKSWQQGGGVDHTEDSVDYFGKTHIQPPPPRSALPSRFNSKYKQTGSPSPEENGAKPECWEGDDGNSQEHSPPDQNEQKLKDFVNNLVED